MNNILIGADVVPYGSTEKLFLEGNSKEILGDDLYKKWLDARYRFFNLECPITNSNNRIEKCGPHLKCNPKAVNGIKELQPTCVMLANNHIMDYSAVGLKETINELNSNRIDWIGVGEDISTLKKTFSFKCGSKKVSIYNCCEHEFSIATSTEPGANPYDELEIFDEIKGLKKDCDYLIIIYHGGKEYYRYPSPLLQKRCRKMADSGANLVICQHSHCVGCKEEYGNGTIVYGQGNFIFNKYSNEYWDTSLLIDIDIENNYKIDYLPLVRTENGTSLAFGKQAKEILDGFNKRSLDIKSQGFIEKQYKEFAKKELDNYIIKLNRHNGVLKLIHKLSPKMFCLIKFRHSSILNAVECEAHNELLIEGLKERLKRNKR